jgi:hypothetical protein
MRSQLKPGAVPLMLLLAAALVTPTVSFSVC